METALDQYVALEDSHYRYELYENQTIRGEHWTGYVAKMYSQQWLTPDDWYFDEGGCAPPGDDWDAVWWHWMLIIVPDKLDPAQEDKGFIWVTGGHNRESDIPTNPNSEDNFLTATLCVDMGVVGAVLYQVPNQPLCFTDENPPKGRSEDAMIAWTWKHFLENPGDPMSLTTETEWLARLPMTKATVRAMDTLADFRSAQQKIDKFVVSGASKRGWTTWTTGLVDDRVIAIIPIVLDVLHMVPSLHHMWRAYCGWTFAFEDYYDIGLTANIDSPAFQQLCAVVDPYNYLADPTRLTMPKLVINTGNDEFLQGDNDFYWWDNMPEPKFRQMCQNTEHSTATGIPEVVGDISAWGNALLNDLPQPNFTWTIDPNDGHIDVYNLPNAGGKIVDPINVTMWNARNVQKTNLRDWRIVGGWPLPLPQLAVLWHPTTLTETSPGSNHWVASMEAPTAPGEWEAFFVEMFIPGPTPFWNQSKLTTYRLTTQISIVPKNVWACQDCYGEGCYGELM
jgi:PhoPQ-activated pathogenicity-related protein